MRKTRQKRVVKLIRLEEALRRIERSTSDQPRRVETVKTVQALGRVLAEDIISEIDLPNHNFAAMDGFAVNTKDIQEATERNPVPLTVKGEIHPSSHPVDAFIKKGEAMYVSCGSPIPRGADAVLKVENARQEDAVIIVQTQLEPNRNICLIGEDVKKQELVLPKSSIIRPQDIGLLVALNRETVNVNQKPRVAIISVGDELTAPFQGASNMFVNNNAYIIASLIEAFKADPLLIEIAQDTFEDVTQKIITSTRKADIIITIAGCSVGAKDFVPDVVENGDGDGGLIFHGVALNAGKVSGFGLVRSKPVAMLPGHVESTVAAFHLFVLPLLNRYLGVGFRDHLPTIKCVLDEPIWKGKPGVDLVLPMKIYRRDAEYHAIPMRKPPSVLKNIADANGFALIHDGVALKAGEVITVKLYSSLEFNTQRIAKDHNEEYQRLYATDVLSAISNEQRKID